jgi:hypothetical protein
LSAANSTPSFVKSMPVIQPPGEATVSKPIDGRALASSPPPPTISLSTRVIRNGGNEWSAVTLYSSNSRRWNTSAASSSVVSSTTHTKPRMRSLGIVWLMK